MSCRSHSVAANEFPNPEQKIEPSSSQDLFLWVLVLLIFRLLIKEKDDQVSLGTTWAIRILPVPGGPNIKISQGDTNRFGDLGMKMKVLQGYLIRCLIPTEQQCSKSSPGIGDNGQGRKHEEFGCIWEINVMWIFCVVAGASMRARGSDLTVVTEPASQSLLHEWPVGDKFWRAKGQSKIKAKVNTYLV
ncbi:hypothetical protein BDP27DRAFT_1374344 [Rhodocollybia butyracea]|uniref:Uncharacterized protein n=1 Tax=Rhodocollybia butyracea TaxID=206335 RepID=A0A9P5P6U0_9AGAR|nr:hypothetical protein BDP27DRAFT_1374344 [Rhodocollybia butyracea]